MECPISDEHIEQLKSFIDLCDKQPIIINHPKLSFLKSFILKLGGKVPQNDDFIEPEKDSQEYKFDSEEPENDESDIELDMTGVIQPDNDAPQPMGDYYLQPTDEQTEKSQTKRSQAVSAFVEKDYKKAIDLYTEAIELNPQNSLLYAKRGQVYLLLNKPNACIQDCIRAMELNPDSAAAHKFRGRANQLLGKFEEAANDLRKACKFDFDEQADEWLREVTPNARKIEEHKRKKERRALERQDRERQERLKKAREAQAKAREESIKNQQQQPSAGGPDLSGARGPSMSGFTQFLSDPEILQAFQDSEVAEAFKDISQNPSNILKYQSNPKIMALISKVSAKFGSSAGLAGMMGGLGGMMGGMGDNMPGFDGVGASANSSVPPKSNDDFGLD